jgi:hypothetical protein
LDFFWNCLGIFLGHKISTKMTNVCTAQENVVEMHVGDVQDNCKCKAEA